MAGKKGGNIFPNQITTEATNSATVTTSSPTASAYGFTTATTSTYDILKNIRLNSLGGSSTASLVAGIDKSQGYYDLNFKSITVSGDLVLTESASSINIALKQQDVNPVYVENGINLGTSSGKVFKSINGSAMEFRTIKVGNNLLLTQDNEYITIDLGFDPIFGDVTDGANLGFSVSEVNTGIADKLGIFHSKTNGVLNFRRLTSASTILSISPDSTNEQIVFAFNESQINLANTSGSLSTGRITGLHSVATSGNYLTLTNRPNIPTSIFDMNDVIGTPSNGNLLQFQTGIGWTPVSPPYNNSFGSISAGTTNIAADSSNSNIQFIAGSELTIEGNASTKRISYNLRPSGVVAGSYTNANIQVDTYGRITGASSGTPIPPLYADPLTTAGDLVYRSNAGTSRLPVGSDNQVLTVVSGMPMWQTPAPSSSATGSVTSVGLIGRNGIRISGGPITSSGVIDVGFLPTGVAAGTYNLATITVDEFGRITAASNNAGGSTVSINAGAGLTGGGDLSQSRTLALTMTGVLAGTYSSPQITVDVYGRITAISGGAAGGAVTSVNGTGQNGITVSGGPITGSGSLTISLANSGVSAGTYGIANYNVNAQGRITNVNTSNPVGIGPGIANGDGEPIIDSDGGIYFAYYTSAALSSATNPVNTTNKDIGKAVLNIDNFFVYIATGENPTDPWVRIGNTNPITPA